MAKTDDLTAQISTVNRIQNHGVLLACTPKDKIISYASDNTQSLFDKDASAIIGQSIYNFIDEKIIGDLFEQLLKRNRSHKEVIFNKQNITVVAHRSNNLFIVEFESNSVKLNLFTYQMSLAETATEINAVSNVLEKCDYAASLISKHLGYDRTMIFHFDASWNMDLIAEERAEHLESWLGLRFPTNSVHEQTHNLLLKQSVRIIYNTTLETVGVVNARQQSTSELNLSRCELREHSAEYLGYINALGVVSALTVGIIHDNQLWGLITCYNYSPKHTNFYQRQNSVFLAQLLATSIHLSNTDDVLDQLKKNAYIRSNLIEQINDAKSISRGLTEFDYTINSLTNSHGAAVYIDNELTTVGNCPANDEIIKLITGIKELNDTQLYYTSCLKNDFPEAEKYKTKASGVLCLFISIKNNDAVLWFKPEVIKIVQWAGSPDQPVGGMNNKGGIALRQSFEKQSIEQKAYSEPWEDHEISEGVNLQKSIQDIVIAKYDEVRELNSQLNTAYEELESFSYSISHDLRAPLRGIDGFAHILKEDYYEKLDDFGQSSVDTIISSITKMNLLIDDILEYSSLGRKTIEYRNLSVDSLVQELLPDLLLLYNNAHVVIEKNLPDLRGDRTIVLLLIKNLLENAMKYSSKVEDPKVTIGYAGDSTFFVKDNGIGFDMKHKDKIFGVFDRLVTTEYPGSGIGLAIAKRVVNKHNGSIWVESQKNQGSTFYFTLAKL